MNYKKCKYAKEVGQVAVYVTPGCPNGHLIKGYLVTTKKTCEKCKRERMDEKKTIWRDAK